MFAAVFFVTVGSFVACTGDDPAESANTADTGPPEPQLVEYEDVGAACLGSFDGIGANLVADAVATVYVTLESCASSCAEDVEASCTASLNGADIEVTAQGNLTIPDPTAVCPPSCEVVQAQCDTPTLPAGSYTLSYAGDDLAVDVPSMPTDACTASPFR